MPNTYACKGVSNPNVPIFPPRVCTLVLFIIIEFSNESTEVQTLGVIRIQLLYQYFEQV